MLMSFNHSIRLAEQALANLSHPFSTIEDFAQEYAIIHKMIVNHIDGDRGHYWNSAETPEGYSRLSGELLDALNLCDTEELRPCITDKKALWNYCDLRGDNPYFRKPVTEQTIRKHLKSHLTQALRLTRIYGF